MIVEIADHLPPGVNSRGGKHHGDCVLQGDDVRRRSVDRRAEVPAEGVRRGADRIGRLIGLGDGHDCHECERHEGESELQGPSGLEARLHTLVRRTTQYDASRSPVAKGPSIPRIGVITDVHANFPALQAALLRSRPRAATPSSTRRRVGIGPHPAECLDLLLESGAEFVLGNHDAYFAFGLGDGPFDADGVAHHRWTHEQLDPALRHVVGAWPWEILDPARDHRGEWLLFTHYGRGTAGSSRRRRSVDAVGGGPRRRLRRDRSGGRLLRPRPRGVRRIGDRRYVNPGSVGCFSRAEARFAIVDADPGGCACAPLRAVRRPLRVRRPRAPPGAAARRAPAGLPAAGLGAELRCRGWGGAAVPRTGAELRCRDEHRDGRVHDRRVELRAGAAPQLGDRLVRRARRRGTTRSTVIAEYASARPRCGPRSGSVAGQAVGVAGAVEALVVVADGGRRSRGRRCGAGSPRRSRRACASPPTRPRRAARPSSGSRPGSRPCRRRGASRRAGSAAPRVAGSPTASAIDAARSATWAQWRSAMPSRSAGRSASACARRIASGSSATRSSTVSSENSRTWSRPRRFAE